MALLCLYINCFSQKINIEPYYIGDRVPDLQLTKLVNYKDSVAKLSSFGHKLIILDFWGVHCGSCVTMFPLEDSLQKIFKDDVQFILVTTDSTGKVAAFLKDWNAKHKTTLELPVITEDGLLRRLFRHYYVPHYAWLAPDGSLLAQTLDYFINKETIRNALLSVKKNEQHLKEKNFPKDMFRFKQPGRKQVSQFTQTQNQK